MISRALRIAAAGLIGLAGLASAAFAADPSWKADVPEIRIGILGSENSGGGLAEYNGFKSLLEKTFNVPVKLYPSSDYAGIMNAMAAGQVDISLLGASSYAGLWLDCKCVEPMAVSIEKDGTPGYYSVLYVKADSPYQKLADLKGKSLAFGDPNSTSGYLIPNFDLKDQGYDPASFFGSTGFSGGHEQSVIAVLKGQYDAGVGWSSQQGDIAQGFTTGVFHSMVGKGLLDMKQIRILWQSGLIPNSPWTVRSALPEAFRKDFTDFLMALPKEHHDIYVAVQEGDGLGYKRVGRDLFEGIVKMREAQMQARRKS